MDHSKQSPEQQITPETSRLEVEFDLENLEHAFSFGEPRR